ncbi:minor capsid protein [Staphylococcus capitis]|uniref:minor capsid protein n=1 Tax=Staphylococcus capitis TaxID=29388 RepID=UPI002DBE1329|nr:minor capsid protein [Staphylococcus capitis]MEB5628935.1 minor capsid protein [Staphylococcus capitis]
MSEKTFEEKLKYMSEEELREYKKARKQGLKYWRKRAKENIQQEQKHDDEVFDKVKEITSDMLREIDKEISNFYVKYAKDEGIPLAEAKKKIDETDIKDLESRVKKYVATKDKSEKANRLLKQFNTKMKISREQMLKQQIRAIMINGTGIIDEEFYKYFENAVQREIKRQSGVIGESFQLKPSYVRAIVNADFKGKKWSDRLWDNNGKIQKRVEDVVSQVMLRGRHPNEFASKLAKDFNVSMYEAKRLLQSETARVQSEAQKLHYQQTMKPDAYVEYIAKIDKKTSLLCKGMDGKLIKVKDLKPGVNMPPLHAFCRSTTAPHIKKDEIDDFFEELEKEWDNNVFDKEDNEDDSSSSENTNKKPEKMPTTPKKPNQNDSGSNKKPNKIPNNDNNRPKKPKNTTQENNVSEKNGSPKRNKTPNPKNKRDEKEIKEIDEVIETIENNFGEELPKEEIDIVIDTLEQIKNVPNKVETKEKIDKNLSFLPFSLLALLIKLLEKIGVI